MTTENFNTFLKENDIKISAAHEAPAVRGHFECRNGWLPLLVDLMKEAIEAGWNRKFSQVKEKYGTLRFYADIPIQIERKYELLSSETCEICGEKGELRNHNGWYTTLCDEHNIKIY